MTARVTFDFTGTRVLITGGTSGIGLATAHLFRDAGADVVITGTRSSAAEYDVDLSGMRYHPLALTEEQSIDELVASITELDVLINNGGANFPNGLDESKPDGFALSVAMNLTGTYRLTVGLRPVLAVSNMPGGASVVNVASMSALRAVPLVPGYSAAKAGIVNVTRNLAVTWATQGIRINAIAPGTIDTPMMAPAKSVPEILSAELAHIPLGRLGTVDEVTPTIAFLCTEHSAYTSGAVFVVDAASDCV